MDARSQGLRILAIPRGLERLVKRERDIAGDSKVIQRNINQGLMIPEISINPQWLQRGSKTDLLGLPRRHPRLDLAETLGDEQDSINQHAIGRAIDFKVSEEDIGAEQGEDLIDAVVRLAVRGDIGVGDIRW